MGLPGNGAEVYYNTHKNETHLLVFESDAGTTKPYGFGYNGGNESVYIETLLKINHPRISSEIFKGDRRINY